MTRKNSDIPEKNINQCTSRRDMLQVIAGASVVLSSGVASAEQSTEASQDQNHDLPFDLVASNLSPDHQSLDVTISKQDTDEEVLDREVRLPPVNGQKNPLRPINVPNNIKESGWYRLSVDIGGKSESTDIYLRDDGFPSFTMGTVYVKPNGEPKVQSATA